MKQNMSRPRREASPAPGDDEGGGNPLPMQAAKGRLFLRRVSKVGVDVFTERFWLREALVWLQQVVFFVFFSFGVRFETQSGHRAAWVHDSYPHWPGDAGQGCVNDGNRCV